MTTLGQMDGRIERRVLASLKQVFASPTFVGSPLLTVLDELQVVLNTVRLDAQLRGREDDPISSAIKRERDADRRSWTTFAVGTHQKVKWRLEDAESPISPLLKIRKALSESKRRLILEFEIPYQFLEEDTGLTVMTLWFLPDSVTGNNVAFITPSIEQIVSVVNASLQTASEAALPDDPFKEISYAFNLDERTDTDREARESLGKAFERFDQGLKSLLARYPRIQEQETQMQETPTREMTAYAFLNQFFWVTPKQDGLAHVMPVFLTAQYRRLVKEAETLKKQESSSDSSPERDVHSISTYEMDSSTLFSAFPADTGFSLYVEDWPHDRLPTESPKLRALFKRLTWSAHESAAREAGLTDEKLNLFSVPVLVGRRPLFVVQMSLPVPLKEEMRIELAAHIRELGGVMYWEARVHRLNKQLKEERRHERSRRHVMQEMLAHYYINKVTGHIPVRIMNPLKDAFQRKGKRENEVCEIPGKILHDVIKECEEEFTRVTALLNRLPSRAHKTINLIEALKRAIPESHRHEIDIEIEVEQPVSWQVKVVEEFLVLAVNEIVTTILEECTAGGRVKIKLRKKLMTFSQWNVLVQFHGDHFTQSELLLFEPIAQRSELIGVAVFGLQSMSGRVEYDKSVPGPNQNDSHAHCIVALPLIWEEKPTWNES
jgi:hypothetical protein